MRTYAIVLPMLGISAILCAQEPPSTEPSLGVPNVVADARLAAKSEAWREFQATVEGTWVSRWNYATETPGAIYGTGLALQDWRGSSVEEARRHSEWALLRWHDLLGLGVSEFREDIAARMGRTWSFVYTQHFQGLPVLGGRADVRIHETGVLSMLGSVAWPVPAGFNTVPALDEPNAVAIAWRRLGLRQPRVGQPGRQGARLVIWGDAEAATRQPFFLAWEVAISSVDAEGQGPIGRFYIDAITGSVLHYENDKHECHNPACKHPHHALGGGEPTVGPPAPVAPVSGTVMAWTRTGLSAVSPLANIPLAGLEVVVPGVGTAVTDANGFFTIDSTLTAPVNVTVDMNGIHNQLILGANPATQTLSVTPGVPAAFQLLTSGATSNEAAHTSTYYWVYQVNELCRSILGNTSQLNTASNVRPTVNIASTCNAYYTNNTINFYAAGGNCNNTGFSSVVAHEWGHGIDDRYGGISQTNGLSEGWGDICSMYLVDDPIVGRDFTTAGGIVRTGTNTRQYPTGSGVHQQGESWMGFAWKFRERMRALHGTPTAIAVSNQIVIGTLPANATNQANAVLQVYIADDDDGNLLNGTPHHAELTFAAQQHSLPFPAIEVGGISHLPLADTTMQLTPRRVDAIATPNFGSFTEVRVHYDVGGGPQSSPMLPSGPANSYMALIPGVLAPFAVTYHFEAVHDSGPTVRLPATGEYTALTGLQTPLFFDSLEGGAPGWTHGMVATQDDWQLGRPFGLTGTGWADPAAAASGTNCWGNDLGPTGWNGAYQNNVNNWLRTPTFSTVGFTGVKLRFKRWLTVQSGASDQASILVNGTQVWVNPGGANTIDTAWSTFELPIPQADNNPSVQIEWRLVTNASTVFGGWNIDDIEVFAVGTLPPLPARLQLLPVMPALGAPMTLDIAALPSAPFLLVLGSNGGPTILPGIPPILVGGSLISVSGFTNGLGSYQVPLTAPTDPGAVGTFVYTHVLTLDGGGSIVASNQFLNLFRN